MIPIRLLLSLYAEEALVDVGKALSIPVVDAGNEVGRTVDMVGLFDVGM
jgi:hypothetical protein